MTVNDAYNNLCEFISDTPFVVSCRDFPQFYAFYIAAGDTQESQPVFINNQALCVDKDTGEVFSEDQINEKDQYKGKKLDLANYKSINFRNELQHSDEEDDEDLYGVPELKKFPMPDKKHVKSAIRFFNYVDPKYEKELAEAILEKAEEFGLDLKSDISVGDENRLKKYLPEKKEES